MEDKKILEDGCPYVQLSDGSILYATEADMDWTFYVRSFNSQGIVSSDESYYAGEADEADPTTHDNIHQVLERIALVLDENIAESQQAAAEYARWDDYISSLVQCISIDSVPAGEDIKIPVRNSDDELVFYPIFPENYPTIDLFLAARHEDVSSYYRTDEGIIIYKAMTKDGDIVHFQEDSEGTISVYSHQKAQSDGKN